MILLEIIGTATTLLAVTGVVLNNYRRTGCFYVWLVSNSLSATCHIALGLWSLTARDVIFLVLAVHGLRCWRRKATEK